MWAENDETGCVGAEQVIDLLAWPRTAATAAIAWPLNVPVASLGTASGCCALGSGGGEGATPMTVGAPFATPSAWVVATGADRPIADVG